MTKLFAWGHRHRFNSAVQLMTGMGDDTFCFIKVLTRKCWP